MGIARQGLGRTGDRAIIGFVAAKSATVENHSMHERSNIEEALRASVEPLRFETSPRAFDRLASLLWVWRGF